jgi:hypothetical protein
MSRFALNTIGTLLVVGGAVAAFAGWRLAQPLALPASPVVFDVRPGQTLKTVARELAADKVLDAAWPLVALARLRGVDRAIKAGNYEIEQGVTLPGLLDQLTQGTVTQTSLTIVEARPSPSSGASSPTTPTSRSGDPPLPDGELMAKLRGAGHGFEAGSFPRRISSRPERAISRCSVAHSGSCARDSTRHGRSARRIFRSRIRTKR